MSDLGIQLRVLMFAMVAPFAMVANVYGYDQAVMAFAVVAAVLSLAISWCDARARR